jgi:hypothetical protein
MLPGPGHHREERDGPGQDENGGDLGHAPNIGRSPKNLLKVSSKVA